MTAEFSISPLRLLGPADDLVKELETYRVERRVMKPTVVLDENGDFIWAERPFTFTRTNLGMSDEPVRCKVCGRPMPCPVHKETANGA